MHRVVKLSIHAGESGLVYRGYLDNAVGRELVAIKTVKGE